MLSSLEGWTFSILADKMIGDVFILSPPGDPYCDIWDDLEIFLEDHGFERLDESGYQFDGDTDQGTKILINLKTMKMEEK